MIYGPDRTRETGEYMNVCNQEVGEWKIYPNIWNTSAPGIPDK